MATVTLARLPRGILDDQATNLINQHIEEIEWLLTGNLDVKNIRANGIQTKNLQAGAVTADKITVTQLSAIAADLGHITAGLIEAITIIGSTITGSLIQTSESSYPRAELSSTSTLFRAASDALKKLEIIASFVGYPTLLMTDTAGTFSIQYGPDVTIGANRTTVSSDNGFFINAVTGDIDLYTNLGVTVVNSWTKFENRATSQTLQQALDAKANTFSGFTGSFSTGTQTVNVVNGIITSVV